MELQLQKDADKFINSIFALVIAYSLVYVGIIMMVWSKIEIGLSKEIMRWRNLFRLVPEPIILSNKALKSYLLKNKKPPLY